MNTVGFITGVAYNSMQFYYNNYTSYASYLLQNKTATELQHYFINLQFMLLYKDQHFHYVARIMIARRSTRNRYASRRLMFDQVGVARRRYLLSWW